MIEVSTEKISDSFLKSTIKSNSATCNNPKLKPVFFIINSTHFRICANCYKNEGAEVKTEMTSFDSAQKSLNGDYAYSQIKAHIRRNKHLHSNNILLQHIIKNVLIKKKATCTSYFQNTKITKLCSLMDCHVWLIGWYRKSTILWIA